MKKEISIYIHFPFCEQKCFYCDFCSFANAENYQEKYIDKLIEEIEWWGSRAKDKIKTIYLGGGTPSTIYLGGISKVMQAIKNNFDCECLCEATIECNPNSLTEEKLNEYLSCGIKRISLGVQSLDDVVLQSIGRVHTSNQARNTLKMLQEKNINFSVDIMSALPNQTMDTFISTLREIISFEPKHISCYSLILEENTPLYNLVQNGDVVLPSEELAVDMFDYARSFLSQNGYDMYEVSNFAKSGFECRHNMNYWRVREYLGFGLSAHSYYDGYRFSNGENLKKYLKKTDFGIKNADFSEKIDKNMQKIEFLMLGLRMTRGIKLSEYQNKFNENLLETKKEEINFLLNNGFLTIQNDKLFVPQKSMRLLNLIIERLI